MKAKYLSLAALALMGALASCQSDDDFTVARPDNAVSVNFSVGSLQATTRSNAAATDDTQREFNQGDQISVSTNDQEAVIFQCTSTENQTWTEATAGKFLLWTQPMLTFSAYYPATTGTSMTAFTLPADQSSEAKIALADYMTRLQNISRPEGGSDIQMQLERKMARVIVRISGFGSQYRDDQKTVDNVRIYSQASGIEDGNPTGSSTEIQPYAQGSNDGWGWSQNSTFTALVVPGSGDDGADFITLRDGENNTLRVKGIPELEAGNSYTFNLVVGKNRIEVASVTVQDWTTGETLAGGQAQEQGGASTPTLSLTSPAVGQVIGSDGKNYAYGSLPTGVTAVAKICYVSGSNGLALALTDEGKMEWSTAIETCAAHTAPFTGGTWKLATTDEWDNMINAAGGYTALQDGFSSVGGTNMQSDSYYWSSTENGSDFAWYYDYVDIDNWDSGDKEYEFYVRACLDFTVEQGSASTTLDNTTTAWTAGSYAVPTGGLTYSDAITVSGDVTLTLTDGETLTLNKGISLAEGATLTVEGNGTMNINGTDGNTSSTVGGNHGTLVLTSGTLTARGGNGGSVGDFQNESQGGNGGDAINGSVIVSGGTLTARGGNGGSVGIMGDYCSGGNGGDAISGTLTINGGSTSVNDGSNGSLGDECEDCTAGTGGKGHN